MIDENTPKPAQPIVRFPADEHEDEHFDIYKMLYGGCGACPHHDGCGSADDEEPAVDTASTPPSAA